MRSLRPQKPMTRTHALIIGTASGAVRAIVAWLLDHVSH